MKGRGMAASGLHARVLSQSDSHVSKSDNGRKCTETAKLSATLDRMGAMVKYSAGECM